VLWGDVLVDGHNRYRICTTHDLDYDTVQREFADRVEVADWIDANQLGRRNLSPEAMSLLRGRRYNRTKNANGVRLDSGQLRQTVAAAPKRTSASLGEEHGVSHRTIERDGRFADAVETLKPHVPDIEQRVLAGDVPSKAAVLA